LVLTAENNVSNQQFNLKKIFNDDQSLLVGDESDALAHFFPFLYTRQEWAKSKLNPYEIIKRPKVIKATNEAKRGICMTDKQCQKYQKIKPMDIIAMFHNTEYSIKLDEVLSYITKWVDIQENEASSVLLCCALNPSFPIIYKIYKDNNIEDYDITNRIKILKYYHTVIRLTGRLEDGTILNDVDYSNLQYMQDLANRRVYIDANNMDELYNDLQLRMQPPPGFRWINIDANGEITGEQQRWYEELKITMSTINKEIVDNIKITELESFDEAWNTRALFMPSGAATGYKSKNAQPLDKRAAHELGYIKKEDVLSDDPIVYASASMKYENGKCRYLYSTDVHDQMRVDYILRLIDKHMHVIPEIGIGLSQKEELLKEAQRSLATRSSDSCFSFDFEDYNNQHTKEVLTMIWQTLSDAIYARFGEQARDYVNVIKIIIESYDNTFIGKKGNNGLIVKIHGTLLSGSRQTQHNNSIANVAYARTINRNYQELLRTYALKWIHAVGDDQSGETFSRLSCFIYILLMLVCGCEGNSAKILTGIEFLRRMYYKNGAISGYLNRSIANLVSRDQNRTERVDKHNIPQALMTQMRKIISRGGIKSNCIIFYNEYVKAHSKLISANQTVEIPFDYIHSLRQNGGLGLMALDEQFSTAVYNPQGSQPQLIINDYNNKVTSGMTYDLIQHLKSSYDIKLSHEQDLLQRIRNKNVINLATTKDKDDWYNRLVNYYKDLKIVNRVSSIEIAGNPLTLKIISMINMLFDGKQNVDISNPIERATTIIAASNIKNYDIFNNLVSEVKAQRNTSYVSAMIYVIKSYLKQDDLVIIITNIINKYGSDLLTKVLTGQIIYNSVLEGYIRDSILTFIRNYVINEYCNNEAINKMYGFNEQGLITCMFEVEYSIYNERNNGSIWKYMLP